jgi:hypothetical protein
MIAGKDERRVKTRVGRIDGTGRAGGKATLPIRIVEIITITDCRGGAD